ncbi:hypothetical protein [Roseovarius tolerans]|uniref:hypothetical protein n=1 Tax=Roseovarius tolerans TaxID=74031 RepID=UPI0009422E78|nr:hypothetical protein [Roseovarius tolerans]
MKTIFLLELEAIPADKRQEKLIRGLTYRLLEKTFFAAYADIFGSQIRALEELNSRNISKSEADLMFKELQREFEPFKVWTLEKYLTFLFRFEFIEISEDVYSITQTGRNFLVFLSLHGLTKERSL